ncbi:hypothetical protein SAMN04489835_0534 [Mycolicibacterium rutilum]|uniref:Uncharacterized protein n=1 Tax=Mycolicibacterium rutilum TaxID=370526 RepID=A0A1H6INZ0_MYCRU|nr:hypothetical protein [Mycolicibacterium rutilum]SEH49705.1 hypothetical protein SAMN04489835_0534 [Mycolicibacterium rutilum]
MMTKTGLLRRVPVVAGVAAVLALGAAACSSEEEQAPETSTTTTTTTTTGPAATPTEKAPRINPNEPNPFTPTHLAPPPATATPGHH